MKFFPIPFLEILPIAVAATALESRLGPAREVSTTRDPVVAPAGTVLRVRLNQTLEAGRSRPGDRFSGVLDTAVVCDQGEVLPRGTLVEGRVVILKEPGSQPGAVLALTLEDYQRNGRRFPVSTNVVARRIAPGTPSMGSRLSVAENSIMGFTLTGRLSVAAL